MMTFHSPPDSLTPEVMLAPELGTFRITGECYPEDPSVFFAPILQALGGGEVPAAVEVTMRLSYVNSASAMWLRRVFVALDALAARAVPVNVTWEYDVDDDVSLELGRDLAHQLQHLHVVERAVG